MSIEEQHYNQRVYVAKGGTSAHRLRGCAGTFVEETTWREAKADGRKPCGNCAKHIALREALIEDD